MTTPAQPGREPSAIDAAQNAIEHTKRHLFPFRFERWITLGFVAFLDQCGRGGGFGNPLPSGTNGGAGSGGGDNSLPEVAGIIEWLTGNFSLVVAGTVGALTLILALTALVLWINSRGIFIYLDNVATGRWDVARPWREHAELAGSLFAWRFGLAAATLVSLLTLVLLGVLLVYSVQKGGIESGVGLGVALLLLLPGFLLLLVVAALLSLALRDFVAPLQLARKVSCGDALREFGVLLKANLFLFILYVVLKIAFHVGLAVVWMFAGCLTCCIGLLPVVGQTLLQPAFYFERAWSLYLLRQLGYDLIRTEPTDGGAAAPPLPPALPPAQPGSPPPPPITP